jgi:hypothetical protein
MWASATSSAWLRPSFRLQVDIELSVEQGCAATIAGDGGAAAAAASAAGKWPAFPSADKPQYLALF